MSAFIFIILQKVLKSMKNKIGSDSSLAMKRKNVEEVINSLNSLNSFHIFWNGSFKATDNQESKKQKQEEVT